MPYQMNCQPLQTAKKLTIGFDATDPQTNAEMVRDVDSRLTEMISSSNIQGELLLITGPASLPIACVLSHRLSHLFGAIGIFDPKLEGYVISISHSPNYKLGEIIKEAAVAPDSNSV